MGNLTDTTAYKSRTDNPLGEANELFGPYDAENYLTLTLAETMEHAAALQKYSVQLRTNHYPSQCAGQNAVSALMASLPRLYLAAERMSMLTGGPFNADATPFYSIRQVELDEISARNKKYKMAHI